MKRRWEPEELVEHWTLLSDELKLLSNKTGATRLGFAILLKAFQLEGRFPKNSGEVPQGVIEYVAKQAKVPGEALAAYEQLINLYPNSKYLPEADSRVKALNELLAEHDWIVGQFYQRNRRYEGALWRFQYIQENYPNFSKIDAVNAKISDLETLIEERDAAWKKRLEELRKKTADKTED